MQAYLVLWCMPGNQATHAHVSCYRTTSIPTWCSLVGLHQHARNRRHSNPSCLLITLPHTTVRKHPETCSAHTISENCKSLLLVGSPATTPGVVLATPVSRQQHTHTSSCHRNGPYNVPVLTVLHQRRSAVLHSRWGPCLPTSTHQRPRRLLAAHKAPPTACLIWPHHKKITHYDIMKRGQAQLNVITTVVSGARKGTVHQPWRRQSSCSTATRTCA